MEECVVALGLNKVIAIGAVEREPELRYMPSAKPVAVFSLATHRQWLTSERETRQSTERFNVIAWGRLAEMCAQMLHQGTAAYIEGHLQTRSWMSSDNRRCQHTELVVHDFMPLAAGDNLRHINKVMIVGALGGPPEMRRTPAGLSVTSLSVLTRLRWRTSDDERHETAERFNVLAWGELADQCSQNLWAGQKVYVEGHFQTRRWLGQDGRLCSRNELVAAEVASLEDATPTQADHRLEA